MSEATQDQPNLASTQAIAPSSQSGKRHVKIVDLNLDTRLVDVNEKATGAEIAIAAGFSSGEKPVILWLREACNTVEIRLDEKIDVPSGAPPIFLVAQTDRLFRFNLNGHVIDWPASTISAAALYAVSGKDQTWEIIFEPEDGSSRIVETTAIISLAGNGIERFTTRIAEPIVTIFYNHKPIEIERGKYVVERLMKLLAVPNGYVLDEITIDGDFIELTPTEMVTVKSGMVFIAHAPTGQSS